MFNKAVVVSRVFNSCNTEAVVQNRILGPYSFFVFLYVCIMSGLPASSIKPLQLIQNAAARLILMSQKNVRKNENVTPLFINLHWLPIAARIKFKALMFAYKTTSGSAPLYLNSLLQTYVPLEASVLQMNVALLFIPKRHKITFTDFYIKFPSWWNDLPNSIPAAESLDIFKNRLKTHLFHLYLTL